MKLKLCGLLAAASVLVAVPAVSTADAGPALSVAKPKLAAALKCTKFAHPKHEPVLLVQGYGATPTIDFGHGYVNALKKGGYDTCTINVPSRALGDVQDTAEYVAHAVRTISARTGGKVDIVGHSEGAASSRWAIRWWPDVRSKVDDLVTMAGANHGVPGANGPCAGGACVPAGWQLRSGSKFMAALNAGDETPGHVDVTSIYTVTDELIQPFTVSRVGGAENVAIQSICPGRAVLHGLAIIDAVGYALATDALSHRGPARPSRISRLTCLKAWAPGVSARDVTWLATSGVVDLAGYALTYPQVGAEPALKRYARHYKPVGGAGLRRPTTGSVGAGSDGPGLHPPGAPLPTTDRQARRACRSTCSRRPTRPRASPASAAEAARPGAKRSAPPPRRPAEHESFYFAFGEHDVYTVADLPDNTAAAAIALTVNASGAVRVTTTVLLEPEEIDTAAKRTVDYRAPGG